MLCNEIWSITRHNHTETITTETETTYNTSTQFNYTETIIETTETNITWTEQSHQETLIYSPQNKLIVVSDDNLPEEYWVPTKPKLYYWPSRTIPAEIGRGFSELEVQTIWDAMEALAEAIGNCITFERKGPSDRDYLHFKKGKTCDSRIGYQGGKHVVKLSDGCLDPEEPGAIQHEVLHALGFFHEHSRNDRDNWVEINWDNVQPRDKRDFKKLQFHTFDLPYDYTSVMHYASDAYAIDDTLPTMKPKLPAMNITMMGQRAGLSFTDVQRVRIPYKCDSVLAGSGGNSGQNRNTYQRSDNQDDAVKGFSFK